MVANVIKVVLVTSMVALNGVSVQARAYHSVIRSDDRWAPVSTAAEPFKYTHGPHTATATEVVTAEATGEPSSVLAARSASSPETTPNSPGFVNGFVFAGCYKEILNLPALTGPSFHDNKTLTIEGCTNWCSQKGFGFAGVKKGNTCKCGLSILSIKDTGCNVACAGDNTELCGGRSAMDVYQSG